MTNANNGTTSFEYESQNRLTKTTGPLTKFETFVYDANGNLISSTDRKAQTINFAYNVVNQLIKKTLPVNLVTTFAYDTVGNLTSALDPDSNLTFQYDGASRLTSTATTGSPKQPGVTVNTTYDLNGNRKTMTDNLTGTTNYVYDSLNRLTSLTNPSAQTVNFDYDVLSRRTSSTLPNGTSTSSIYDAVSQLSALSHQLSTVAFSSFAYTYDKVGNRTAMNTVRSAVAVNSSLNYVYDNLYRLISATNPRILLPPETFAYDSLGNRNSLSQTYDSTNRLLDDARFTYTYDNNGNLIQKVDKSTSETTDYIYDAENQLIRIDFADATYADYAYDGLGRRIEKDVSGTITHYVYDIEDILLEYDGAMLQARYTHGPGIDEPLIMDRGGVSHFYHADGLGSITDLTDATGTVVQSYVYNSFGEIVEQVGSLTNPYTYTGREFDEESGLYYYRTRYYDPSIGRFLQEDPFGFLGGDINLYPLVFNNPVNLVDPLGLFVIAIGGSADATATFGLGIVSSAAIQFAVDSNSGESGIIVTIQGPGGFGIGSAFGSGGIVTFSPFGSLETLTGQSLTIGATGGILGKIGISIDFPQGRGFLGAIKNFSLSITGGKGVGAAAFLSVSKARKLLKESSKKYCP